MSLSSILTTLNRPPLVFATGALIAGGFPIAIPAVSLGVLQITNLVAFAINVAAVSVPGRLDGQRDVQMRRGNLNPKNDNDNNDTSSESKSSESTPLTTLSATTISDDDDETARLRTRSLVQPSGWAFSIWGLIYMGEMTFCVAQFFDASGLPSILPNLTGPFVAANLVQSLWCASFRPKYNSGWHKYVSVAMLGGTAYSLSWIPVTDPTVINSAALSWYLLPMAVHFGWTTAATLVNLNSSVAANPTTSESTLVALGHGSAVLATGLGVALTVYGISTPAYGLTVAWALLAVASNSILKPESHEHHWTDIWITGAKVQRALCYAGSALCVAASAFAMAGL